MTNSSPEPRDLVRSKMLAANVSPSAIDAFLDANHRLQEGETGLLPEAALAPVDGVVAYDSLADPLDEGARLLDQLAVIKLNGGLGTSMGLSGPKSLLPVRGRDTFLDLIARQMLRLRRKTRQESPVFLLMNSFSTRVESIEHLARYPDLANHDGSLDFVQNKVPKLDPKTHAPVSWRDDPDLEWCPPGHGDLYPSLLGNDRLLDRLLDQGVRYLFVSNADNLGATVDPRLLRYFAESDQSFLMEVAGRTEVDRKGGHLARRKSDGRLVLRELAQCPTEDVDDFQDISLHGYFNTNNLWIQLEHLRDALHAHGGLLPLPLIQNRKTIDPQQPETPPVLQLESAMGAAIECFDDSGAVLVPRSRFSPVKTTNDLLAVRSDAYETIEDDSVLRLIGSREGKPPLIELDSTHYKMLDRFESLFPSGPPSLEACRSLTVLGAVRFDADVVIQGDVTIVNRREDEAVLRSGEYADQTIGL
ncbi:MAG: UTP--glucose-1-phosphate uridylyltransferase [Planctomycetaceae bacterium]|nr:UTP--glucose-1-phosphate uridylyltransferase [Planctomycetaceae bacterium]